MSWWMHAMPLHAIPAAEFEQFLDVVRSTRGRDVRPAPVTPLPTAGQILSAFRAAGVHGDPWFSVDGVEDALLEGTGSQTYLGEVTLHPPKHHPDGDRLSRETPIESIGFRKPWAPAVMHAALGLAQVAGPLVVFTDDADLFIVIHPDDEADQVAPLWVDDWAPFGKV